MSSKRRLEGPGDVQTDENEDVDAKRRRILEETRDIDADSDGLEDESSDEDRYGLGFLEHAACAYCISDEEDETAELMRELEKIKQERAEQREREASNTPQPFLANAC